MTTNVTSELGDKWLPMHWSQSFTSQRAPDKWFGDELPPTLQDQAASPLVQQSMRMAQQAVRQSLAEGAAAKDALARSRKKKRTKASRH